MKHSGETSAVRRAVAAGKLCEQFVPRGLDCSSADANHQIKGIK